MLNEVCKLIYEYERRVDQEICGPAAKKIEN